MIIVKRLCTTAALAVAVAIVGVPAHAQPKPCRADIDKFCADVERGQGRLIRCLKEHANELAPECKKTLENRKAARKRQPARRQKRAAARRVCDADIQKFCNDTMGNRDKFSECLRTKKSEFSPECREKLEILLKRMDERKAEAEKKS